MIGVETTPSTKTLTRVRELPLIGSLPNFAKDSVAAMQHIVREYGDASIFHLGPTPVILLNRPEHVHSTLLEHAYEFTKGRVIHRAISGNGLFISEGDFHKKQRKLMAPPFQPRHISTYTDIIVSYVEKTARDWDEGTVIDLNQSMTQLTMSIIGKVLFNVDVSPESAAIGADLATIFEYTSHLLTHPIHLPLYWPTSYHRRVRNAIRRMDDRVKRMIDERRQSDEEFNDFLFILLQARAEDGSTMDDRQVMDEAITLFNAGHETTATALTWSWYLLTQHPEAYQKVQQEVHRVLKGRPPTYADLPHLPYCLQVFKEALRLYPPSFVMLREALHDIIIDGYVIHKGDNVMISPYTMHRKEEYYPRPEEFQPERFSPEREKQLPRYAYIPFGAGPRICIGNHLALMEGQLILATLAQRMTFGLLPNQTIEPNLTHNLTLKPGGSVNVKVQRHHTAEKQDMAL